MNDDMKVYEGKASQILLDDLHGKVAKHLATNLDDPKVLNLAITFLKNNNITADIVESNAMVTITDSIKQIADREVSKINVDDLLEMIDD